MDRNELIQTIENRVSVWDDNKWDFPGSGATMVELKNGNKYYIDSISIEKVDVGEFVFVHLYDESIGNTKCYIDFLTDESLVLLADELPLTHTIFVTFHPTYKDTFVIVAKPVRANFDDNNFRNWLSKNFPLLDWEPYNNDYICYTEFTDKTGPYLYATLQASE